MMRPWCYKSLWLALTVVECTAFIVVLPPASTTTAAAAARRRQHIVVRTTSSSSSSSEQPDTIPATVTEAAETTEAKAFPEATFGNEAEIIVLNVLPHIPLGCTVEESLADAQHVFCTAVVANGFAAQAGLLVGDVLVSVTGQFGEEMTNVTGLGIDKVKSLVQACPDAEPLQLRVARGTAIADEHEQALVDLCSNPGTAQDILVDQCVLNYLKDGYNVNAAVDDDDPAAAEEECDPDSSDTDCLVESMYSMWAEDLPQKSNGSVEPTADQPPGDNKKPKPWSLRSSPSGTFARDPVSGEMKNIDA